MNKSYVELRLDLEETTSKKSKELGVFYAFSNDQLIEGLNALNVTKEDAKKRIVNIGQGCFILRENADKWLNLFVEYGKQLNDALKDEAFLLDALVYELRNHEYCISWDATDALDMLSIKKEDIPKHIWKKAHSLSCYEDCCEEQFTLQDAILLTELNK